MRFDFAIQYIPGSMLHSADALSRFSQPNQPELISSSDVVERYVSVIINSLPLTDCMHEKVKSATTADATLQKVITFSNTDWPNISKLTPDLQAYWHSRDQITVSDGLVLCNARIVIPESMRQTTLEALHVGHLGVEKCRSKARLSIWWPKIGTDIERFVTSCHTCQHWAKDKAEPLISTPLPDLPWQKIATDLFEFNNKHYVVVVDYYSRFFELKELRNETSIDVINALKSIFSCHGVPTTCISDNGPCYASAQFAEFARAYEFTHVTSSPRYAQANGAAERAVQTAKSILKKAADPFLALLNYRTTPLTNGYSPAQLLMGRQLRSNVPTTTAALRPHTPDFTKLQQLDRKSKEQQAKYFDRRHCAREGRKWQVNYHVWIPDLKSEATVTNVLPYRSYQLRTAAGNSIRRNGRSLRTALPARATSSPAITSSSPTATERCHIRETHPPFAVTPPPQHHPPMAPYVTRAGRHVKPPNRLNF